MSTIDKSVLQSAGIMTAEDRARANAGSNTRLGQDAFLKLMTTQMQNQDPFKPLESGEFLGQMAQFSTVSGIQDMQASFNQLANSLVSNQALQASALVGREVVVPSSYAVLPAGGGTLRGAIELPAGARNVRIGLYNSAGELVHQLNLGSKTAGMHEFSWDGVKADGISAPRQIYVMKAEVDTGAEMVAGETLAVANVDSVSLGRMGEGITINLADLGSASFSSVRQIR